MPTLHAGKHVPVPARPGLGYRLLQYWVRRVLHLYMPQCQMPAAGTAFHAPGPMLLVSNHPNSFLDAVLLAAHTNQPICFLARGDAFTRPWHHRLLSWLYMLPIYRLAEGKAQLGKNELSFAQAHQLLLQNERIGIFIEGICKGTHQLQPFKKGAARIAAQAYDAGIALQVVALRISYGSLHGGAKSVVVHSSAPLNVQCTKSTDESEAQRHIHFNKTVLEAMESLPDLGHDEDSGRVKAGWLWLLPHLPFYLPLRQWVLKKTAGSVFFDSVWVGVLVLLWPLYALATTAVVALWAGPGYAAGWLGWLCASGWAYSRAKRIKNP